jgi:alcohol dehydrogenase
MNFEYHNPTRLVFGAGSLSRLGEMTRGLGKKALVVTGGGSVKRNGTFDRAVESLKQSGVAFVECANVEPNPRISSVARGAGIVRSESCDVIVALGGGSTMDASKVIAAAALYDGDPWDMIGHGQDNWVIPAEALPIITVPTLAATGSETNCGAVISNDASKVKSFVSVPCLYPKVALVDPELTLTVPRDQTAYGVCDLIVHVTETYFNGVGGTPIQDSFAEGVIRTALAWGPRVVADGSDLEARTQIQWAALVALNGWLQVGTDYKVPVHMIEHAISAHHNVTHGAGLAAINPSWMRFAAKVRPERFAQFAERVFGLRRDGMDDLAFGLKGIDAYVDFLRSIGCPTSLTELGIGDELFDQYADDARLVAHDAEGRLLGRPALSKSDIVAILRAAL